ncbi:hypothetical protein JHL17_17335 [Azospirillum sp. YIM B02556]|uniref:Uncharacterized protein n=1 Tax=Azospirillum endophyticum TaxID=2800326 RepID=A0ABS1F7C3_9PROT|nr:hypothetical protein [Azospirillum endophyticum]MBK1839177.1 hypothetical protein [Azospirillum endophyticum]
MAAIGFMVKTIGMTIESATKRLGFADMFVADILAICNVIDQFDLWKRFEALYGELDYAGIDASPYQARSENYFDLWQKHSHEIGALDQKSIKRITRFYTYLKASRDATLELRYWNKDTPIPVKQICIRNILLTLALSLKNARLSLTSLVDKNELEKENGYSYIKKQNGMATRVLINIGIDHRTINNLGLTFDEDGKEITLHIPE